jgi:PAS domain S-box-containing protein
MSDQCRPLTLRDPHLHADAAILDGARDAVITMDERGEVVLVNAAAEQIFGFSRSDMLGRTVAQLIIPPALRHAHRTSLQRVLDGGASRLPGRPVALPALRADGSEILVEISVTRTSLAPPRFTAWMREPPQAAVAQAGAVRRPALVEALEELAQVGSWDWTPNEARLVWSANLFRIFGLEPEAIAPSPAYVFAVTHPDDRERVTREVDALRSSGAFRPLDYRIVLPDHGVRHLLAHQVVTDWRDGEPYRMAGWVQDVTKQRWAEREIAAHVAVGRALSAWEGLEQGGEQLLRGLAQALGFTVGVLWLPRGDVLVAAVVAAAEDIEVPAFVTAASAARVPRGVGLAGRVWESGRPVVVDDLAGGTPAGPRDAALAEGLRGAVALPVLQDDDVLAVIELLTREDAEPTHRLIPSLSGIGYQLGHFLGRRRGELEPPRLTPREIEVLELAARGLSAPRTAEELVVSPSTVRTHLEHVYEKLGVGDKASAVAAALRQGLIE